MKFSLDSLITRDNRVFAYGWAFDPTRRIFRIGLELTLVDGTVVRLPATYEKERPDVAQAFPAEPSAHYCGWMVYAAWVGAAVRSMALAGEFEGGATFSLPLADPAHASASAPLSRIKRLVVSARAWRYRGVSEALRSARRFLNRPPPAHAVVQPPMLAGLASVLREAGQDRCPLVVDHSMGGGASHYRKSWVTQRLKERPIVLVLSFDIRSLRYTLDAVSTAGTVRQWTSLREPASELAASQRVDQVLYNDAVSFPRPEQVPRWLVQFRAVANTTLTMVVHDYLVVCPSQFLLNDQGRFCGVPEVTECMRCLVENNNEFAGLFPSNDMPEWRKAWSAALACADKIVCFSNSSRTLLVRGYPHLDLTRVRVEPHQVPRFQSQPVIDLASTLHIGIVGSIGWHKGAGVVRDLADEIARRQLPVKITVIGMLDAQADRSVVSTTGGFNHAELPSTITQSGANLFLLPSICPETFSYVAHELMGMNVPLVCFDFGAPAESVNHYRLGCVVPRTNAADLLDRLLRFHSEIASEHTVSQ